MNQREAKALACKTVAKLIDSYLACAEDYSEWPEDDQSRYTAALTQLEREMNIRSGKAPKS